MQVYLINTTVTCVQPPAVVDHSQPFSPPSSVVSGVAAAAAVAIVLGLLLVSARLYFDCRLLVLHQAGHRT